MSIVERIKTLFGPESGAAEEPHSEHALQLASAALLVEMERADHHFEPAERAATARLVAERFAFDEDEARELLELADGEVDRAVSLYEFTSLLHRHLDDEAKRRVLTMLWQAAYADGQLHRYEEQLIRRVADLLYVPREDFIKVKLKVQGGME